MSLKSALLAGGVSLALLTAPAVAQTPPAAPAPAAAAPAAPPAKVGGRPNKVAKIKPVTQADLLKPAGDEWLSYHGAYNGEHFSTLSDVTVANVGQLKRAWISDVDSPVPSPRAAAPDLTARPGETGVGGRSVPGSISSGVLMRSGVLFFTAGLNAYAVDAKTGKQIWHYVARQSGGLSNRGFAISGDKLLVLYNSGITCLDAKTGKELWAKQYGGPNLPMAPLVVRDHVYVTAGGDGARTRGFLASLNVNTGEREWIVYTTPKEGEFGFNTWPSEETAAVSNGSAWMTPAYDPETNLLIYGTGNPTPIKDRRARPGDNLCSDSTLALDADTGKMAWYFQATPNDDHDYDNNQGMIFANLPVDGKPRKLVTWISRNGYQFTLDRVTGEHILTHKALDIANWAKPKLRFSGTPEKDQNKAINRGGVLLAPNSDGYVNFTAQSFSPVTGLHYANTSRTRSMFYWSGEGFFGNTTTALQASDPVTGKVVWEHKYLEPHTPLRTKTASVLSTAGGLLFSGDISGNFIAFDGKTGKILWHDELPDSTSYGVPISYKLDGKQYVMVPAGSKLIAYVLK